MEVNCYEKRLHFQFSQLEKLYKIHSLIFDGGWKQKRAQNVNQKCCKKCTQNKFRSLRHYSSIHQVELHIADNKRNRKEPKL